MEGSRQPVNYTLRQPVKDRELSARLMASAQQPQCIRSDNDAEFTAASVMRCLRDHNVRFGSITAWAVATRT
jgi:hypothetical protein